ILSMVLAFVLTLLLQPAMRLLQRLHLPRAIGALLIILLMLAAIVGFASALAMPAQVWAAKLPDGFPRLAEHLRLLREPFVALQRVLQQAEQVAAGPNQSGTTLVALPG